MRLDVERAKVPVEFIVVDHLECHSNSVSRDASFRCKKFFA